MDAGKGGSGRQGLTCQVPGCDEPIPEGSKYLKRCRVCDFHLKLPAINISGTDVRFCALCKRFQEVDEFDGEKKSCRKALDEHNSRRRFQRRKLAAAGGASGGTPGGSNSGGTAPDVAADLAAGETAAGQRPVSSGSQNTEASGGLSPPQAAVDWQAAPPPALPDWLGLAGPFAQHAAPVAQEPLACHGSGNVWADPQQPGGPFAQQLGGPFAPPTDVVAQQALTSNGSGTVWPGHQPSGGARIQQPGGPFAQQLGGPFAQPTDAVAQQLLTSNGSGNVWPGSQQPGGPFMQQPGGPFAQQLGGPFAQPAEVVAQQVLTSNGSGNVWAGSQQPGGPIMQQPRGPFSQQLGGPFAQPSDVLTQQALSRDGSGTVWRGTQQPGGPFAQQPGGPFAHQPAGPFAQQPGGPFAHQPGGPFAHQPGGPFVQPSADSVTQQVTAGGGDGNGYMGRRGSSRRIRAVDLSPSPSWNDGGGAPLTRPQGSQSSVDLDPGFEVPASIFSTLFQMAHSAPAMPFDPPAPVVLTPVAAAAPARPAPQPTPPMSCAFRDGTSLRSDSTSGPADLTSPWAAQQAQQEPPGGLPQWRSDGGGYADGITNNDITNGGGGGGALFAGSPIADRLLLKRRADNPMELSMALSSLVLADQPCSPMAQRLPASPGGPLRSLDLRSLDLRGMEATGVPLALQSLHMTDLTNLSIKLTNSDAQELLAWLPSFAQQGAAQKGDLPAMDSLKSEARGSGFWDQHRDEIEHLMKQR
ncbi:hypothetical protein N2152v2_003893 [Parachlorella kessleri]